MLPRARFAFIRPASSFSDITRRVKGAESYRGNFSGTGLPSASQGRKNQSQCIFLEETLIPLIRAENWILSMKTVVVQNKFRKLIPTTEKLLPSFQKEKKTVKPSRRAFTAL